MEDESFAVVTRGQEKYEQQKEEKQMSQEKAAQGVANPLLMTEFEKAARGVAEPLLTTESEKAARGVAEPLLTTESEKAARGVAKPLLMTESEEVDVESNFDGEVDVGSNFNGDLLPTCSKETNPGFDFADDLFGIPGENRKKLTKAEKRQQSKERTQEKTKTSSMTLAQQQEVDEDVQEWRKKENSYRVLQKNGVWMRKWQPREDTQEYQQIVLPKQYRNQVLKLAHSLPIAGHLGQEKTIKRLLKRFYWPTLFRDTKEYCRRCPECQLSQIKRSGRAPLIPLPIMGEPFERIAMDIVGPLPRSKQGHRYILVVCDYATRYPEAIPLKKFTAPVIADELIEIFSRHGVPREILTDQGTNFTSQLLQELYKMIGVKPIKTSPYHPQTDGLVERFNQTLKQMLKKTIEEEGRDWHKLIPYVLFAYREVPQSTTGFSPFELIYGRDIRGPLDVLKEGWIQDNPEQDDIVSFVNRVYQRLEDAKEIAHKNMEQVQEKQKKWYDQKARDLKLRNGDQVLVLIPTRTEKLLAKWKGPYTVLRQVGKVNYELKMEGARNGKKIFHINMLKLWKEPEENFINIIDDEQEEIPYYIKQQQKLQEAEFGSQLTLEQRVQIEKLIQEFPEITKINPGKTNQIKHKILTEHQQAVRQRPYRIPPALKENVIKELTELLENGVIEESTSDWASPIVVVKKKDGSNRICVDYRKLNAQTKFDAYPMPRIDEMLDAVGKSQYLTTLDLSKGYWQVPMDDADKEKTAFTSPLGLLQFTVMPFGLSGAPATFQRLMDKILRGTEDYAGVYLDDIIVYGDTWNSHLKNIRVILQRIKDAGLTIKLKKCSFGMSECTYLGHQIGRGGVRPEETKMKAIQEMPIPQTKKEVRSFLGLVGYYRRFIPHFATKAEPLTSLTKKGLPEKIHWNESADQAFQTLKTSLTHSVMLHNPDYSQVFQLQTDASDVGVGAVLSQGGEQDQPIAYYSRKLLDRERNYSTVEKECLAIVLGVKAFATYLIGKPFVLQTDNRALTWLQTFKDRNARLTRWSLALQPYTFTTQHRKGKDNANADALSRLPLESNEKMCFAQKKEGRNVKESFGQAIIDDVTRKRDANQRPARACLMGKRDANQRPAQACLSRPVKTGFCGQTIKGTDQNRVSKKSGPVRSSRT